ncbi:thiamine phosphate synthase, partial [Verminephrobacter sp. Larva24]
GIGAEQFPQVLATGVGSIAVVRALVNAPDPDEAARQLMGRIALSAHKPLAHSNDELAP